MSASSTNSDFKFTNKNGHYYEFEWNIRNFTKIFEYIFSPIIEPFENCPIAYQINLDLKYWETIYLKLEIFDEVPSNLRIIFEYEVKLQKMRCKHNVIEMTYPFENETNIVEIPRPRGQSNLRITELEDSLSILGKVVIFNCCVKTEKNEESVIEHVSQLQSDFKFLFKNQQLTDVTLNIGNDAFKAHKFVLGARSPVFRKMFENDFQESIHNSVDIEDMDKYALEKFLEFLYTGTIEVQDFDTIVSLYSAADKYEVGTLQEACCKVLISELSVDRVTTILKLADMHSDFYLKEKATTYICKNFPNVDETAQWNSLLDTDPRLASYVLKKVCKNSK